SRADLAMRRSSSGLRSSASITSSERRATKSSRPGSKNSFKPSHQSLTIGASQAAASTSLPEGQYPTPAMAARVTFKDARQEELKAACSLGGTCGMNHTLSFQGKSSGY